MFRACLVIFVWILFTIALGIPLLLVGLVYPWRWLLARCGELWARAMLAIGGVRLTVVGSEHRAGSEPRFFMANHQSALDIPIILVTAGGDALFFSKGALLRIPVFGWILWRYGFVSIHGTSKRKTLRALEAMLQRLKRRPRSVAVFPEGTRTRDGRLLPFRKGTMKIAIRAGLAVVPIAIDGSFRVNHRDEFRLRPGPVRVTFTEPIPACEVVSMTATELHDRVKGAIAQELAQTSGPT